MLRLHYKTNMGYAYTVNQERNLVVLRFRGKIDFSEEIEAVISVFKDQRVKPNVHVLIERREASIETDPARVSLLFEIFAQSTKGLGKPKIAVIVADEIDFGMMHVIQIQLAVNLNHDYQVFTNIEDALNWFEIEPAEISIPNI